MTEEKSKDLAFKLEVPKRERVISKTKDLKEVFIIVFLCLYMFNFTQKKQKIVLNYKKNLQKNGLTIKFGL